MQIFVQILAVLTNTALELITNIRNLANNNTLSIDAYIQNKRTDKTNKTNMQNKTTTKKKEKLHKCHKINKINFILTPSPSPLLVIIY